MVHAHHHHHHHAVPRGRRLGIAIALNVAVTLAQAVGGVLSGSLALISDALHNLSDVFALVVSYVGERLSLRPSTSDQTYGYRRAGVVAALVNAIVLVAVAANLCLEAVSRLGAPPAVDASWVMALALAGIVVNGLSALLLRADAGESLNLRSAYVHLLSDMLSSVAVLAGGAAMYLWGMTWIDPALTVLISLYVVRVALAMVAESVRVVMQFTPAHVDLAAIERDVVGMNGVRNLHHVHVWQLTDREVHFQGHVDFDADVSLSEATRTIHAIAHLLEERHGIGHTMLQPEYGADHAKHLIAGGRR